MFKLHENGTSHFSIVICFWLQLILVAANRNGNEDTLRSRTVREQISTMDQILAINSRVRQSKDGNFKRAVVEDNIIKANDAQEVSDDLFEGDIVLDPKAMPEDVELYNLQQKKKKETTVKTGTKRQGTRNMKWLWHFKKVPYEISSSLNQVKHKILKAIATFNSKTCVQFVPKRADDNISVLFDKRQGCYSRIGRSYARPGPLIISIGQYCDYEDIIIHEMLHSVGFFHEQSRPDRQDHIKVLWENVKPGFENEFLQYSHGQIDHLHINYNYDSIMHYGSHAFSKSPYLETIQAINNKGKVKLGGETMSELDVIELDALYRCKTNKLNQWTQWSSYSPCDNKNCYKSRQRFCYGQSATSCGGNANPYGVDTQYVKCPSNVCPLKIHGNWGEWTPWSACSHKCDEGKRFRKRKCDNPKPKNQGQSCKGLAKDEKICVQPRCKLGFDDTDFRNRGLGMWQNDIYDTPGLDWIIGKGDTPTEDTGPHSDHTTGKDFYLYVESSGRRENDIARLVSAMLDQTSPNPKCLRFFYHMFGRSMGSLTVRLMYKGQPQNVLFTRSGSQSEGWKTASLTLNTPKKYQLAFEATIGKQPYSDIAIDDVFIDEGSCDCKDAYRVCKYWAQGGYCKRSFPYMYKYCPRSCNFCGCQDNPKWNCKGWVTECKKNPVWMEVNCPVTCRVCGCYDKSIWCHFWKRFGECKKNPAYMNVNCRKACKFCT